MVAPELAPLEHRGHVRPFVPQIVGDPPHVGVAGIVPGLFHQRRPRRQGQDDRPPAAQDRVVQHFHLMGGAVGVLGVGVGVGDVVALDEVHPPAGILGDQVVVVVLGGGVVGPHAVHVRVPAADAARVGQVGGGDPRRAVDGQVPVGRRPGDAPHDVDAELQPQAVDIVGQRAEPPPPGRGGEAGRVGLQPAELVHGVVAEGDVLVFLPAGAGVFGVPLDVHHHIGPAIGFQLPGQHLGVGPDGLLGDGGVVKIIAVPPHGRRGGKTIGKEHGAPPGSERGGASPGRPGGKDQTFFRRITLKEAALRVAQRAPSSKPAPVRETGRTGWASAELTAFRSSDSSACQSARA